MSMNVTMSQMMLRPPSNFAGILFIVSAKIELIPNYLLSLKKKSTRRMNLMNVYSSRFRQPLSLQAR